VLVTVLLAQTISLAIQVKRPAKTCTPEGRDVMLLRQWVTAVVSPFERLTHWSGYGLRSLWREYGDLRGVRQQNVDLRQQIVQLQREQAALATDALQGHRLQVLMNFQHRYITQTVAAQVIGGSASDASHVLTIDKGTKDGLIADQAVITPDGIVGKLRYVFSNTSQVLLINDSASGVGVVLETTRLRAIVRGSMAGQVQINNLTADSRIKLGEAVLTSGGDQVFPRGLKVGTIDSIDQDPEHQPYTLIRIKPAANLFQLEEVLVITGTSMSMPEAVQKDLQQAAADAAANKTASQLVADRLPSLNGSQNGAKTPDAAAGENPVTIPRPVPTLHPDRYTPGAAPPANTLTPGAANPAPARPAPAPSAHPSATEDAPRPQPKPQPAPAANSDPDHTDQ